MPNHIAVIWDEKINHKIYLTNYFNKICNYNPPLRNYLEDNITFDFFNFMQVSAESLDNPEIKLVFILAERKTRFGLRSDFEGLSVLKFLRKQGIKIPIFLFSFFNIDNEKLFPDKEDFENATFMQFFVHIPEIVIDISENIILHALCDDILEYQKNNFFNKKSKAEKIINQLIISLEKYHDNDKLQVDYAKEAFNKICNWIPDRNIHAYIKEEIINQLTKLKNYQERINYILMEKPDIIEDIKN
jgi:hypothetical protein